MQSCHHDRRYRKLIWRRLGDKADWATGGKESVRGGLAWSAIVLSGFIFFGRLSPFSAQSQEGRADAPSREVKREARPLSTWSRGPVFSRETKTLSTPTPPHPPEQPRTFPVPQLLIPSLFTHFPGV